MSLYSVFFFLFVLGSLICYYGTHRWAGHRQWMILLAISLAFYLIAGHIAYIVFTALLTWGGALLSTKIGEKYLEAKKDHSISRADRKRIKAKVLNQRRIVLILVMMINFGVLGYIKYWPTMWNGLVNILHYSSQMHLSQLLLPLGISFYTFQSMGYLIDVHNDKYPAEKNFFKFLLFISFFPQLIQGPINRFDALARQLYDDHHYNWSQVKYGLILFCFGAMKKFTIADPLNGAVSVIMDKGPVTMPGSMMLFGAFLYAVQQYADFSGGIDMVLGVARMFGIQMAPNFRQPYFSTSLGDFWRRWHITLGAWMRDYVFYPFALTNPMMHFGKWAGKHLGKHCGRVLPACVGNIVVFFLVGIWHGPEIHYILWGLYNGIIIAFSDLFKPCYDRGLEILRVSKNSKGYHVFVIVLTFFVVVVAGFFDRISNVGRSFQFFYRSFYTFDLGQFLSVYYHLVRPVLHHNAIILIISASVLVFINSVLQERGIDTYQRIQTVPVCLRWGIYYLMIILVLLSFLIPTHAGGFMYANF